MEADISAEQARGGWDASIPAKEDPVITAITLPSSKLRLEETRFTESVSSNRGRSGNSGEGELILSCDVFGYIGDLRACFRAVRELVDGEQSFSATEPVGETWKKSPAVFAFSAEAPPTTNSARATEEKSGEDTFGESCLGYELQGTGRWVCCCCCRCCVRIQNS